MKRVRAVYLPYFSFHCRSRSNACIGVSASTFVPASAVSSSLRRVDEQRQLRIVRLAVALARRG